MTNAAFFGDGTFRWELAPLGGRREYCRYDEKKYWGGFPARESFDESTYELPSWSIGPIVKYEGNPIIAPTPGQWDRGAYGGGVHNGSVVVKDGIFHYLYRGEMPMDKPPGKICDIGIAVSRDGIHFTKDYEHTPLFRADEDVKYDFFDVCIVEHEATYYLYCNRWDWSKAPKQRGGVFLATSTDLLHWEKRGLVFPDAEVIHRNACVLRDPCGRAVRAGGRFVMYLNDHLIAYSHDLVNWTSEQVEPDRRWPGGEGCLAVANYMPDNPDHILLFTGGHHSGHFYAIGEVLFSRRDPARALKWLPRPVLAADSRLPHEDGYSATPPHEDISDWRDTVFFTGAAVHEGAWWFYYGGSEFYTCLAKAPAAEGMK